MSEWVLDRESVTDGGAVRWCSRGSGAPIVLVHGTPYSSFMWRDIAPALAADRTVVVFDHLGYGQSEQAEGQDLSLSAQGRRFARLLREWDLGHPSVVATDIGGAIALRALLIEQATFADLTLFDAVSGGQWERGLYQLILEHSDVFEQLPDYAHRALVSSHLHNATEAGFRPGVLETYLDPWVGEHGQAAFYRQYRQLRARETTEYEHLLGDIDIPVQLLWGCEDRILPPSYAEWLHTRLPHASLTWVEGSGHLLAEDAPARLLAHLID